MSGSADPIRMCRDSSCSNVAFRRGYCGYHHQIHRNSLVGVMGLEIIKSTPTVNLKITVPSTTTDGKVTTYRVETINTAGDDGDVFVKEARFSELAKFKKALEAEYSREHAHLLPNFPKFPSKKSAIFHDHFAPSFIEDRRVGFENFFKNFVYLPHAQTSPTLLEFLGVVTKTKSERLIEKLAVVGHTIDQKKVFFTLNTVDSSGEDVTLPYRYSQFSKLHDRLRKELAPETATVEAKMARMVRGTIEVATGYKTKNKKKDKSSETCSESASADADFKEVENPLNSDSGDSAPKQTANLGGAQVDIITIDLPQDNDEQDKSTSVRESGILVDDFPEFPPKLSVLVEDRFTDEFVGARIKALNDYFVELLEYEGARNNDTLLTFCGFGGSGEAASVDI